MQVILSVSVSILESSVFVYVPIVNVPSTVIHFPAEPVLLRVYLPPVNTMFPSPVIHFAEHVSFVEVVRLYIPALPVVVIVYVEFYNSTVQRFNSLLSNVKGRKSGDW